MKEKSLSSLNGLGALASAQGDDTWDSAITLAGDASIGANPATTLRINRAISESTPGSDLTKVGAGTAVFQGGQSNTYTGTTLVNEGVLQLNKTGGAVAVREATPRR